LLTEDIWRDSLMLRVVVESSEFIEMK